MNSIKQQECLDWLTWIHHAKCLKGHLHNTSQQLSGGHAKWLLAVATNRPGISSIPRVSRSLHGKGPSLGLDDVLSCFVCQSFHTHPLQVAMARLFSGFCHILPRSAFLWLLFRRALCQRRRRRRVGCSGQAVPCLVLRRCQQAGLLYMRSGWCNVDFYWC